MEKNDGEVSSDLIGEALFAISSFSHVNDIDGEFELTKKSEKFISTFEHA